MRQLAFKSILISLVAGCADDSLVIEHKAPTVVQKLAPRNSSGVDQSNRALPESSEVVETPTMEVVAAAPGIIGMTELKRDASEVCAGILDQDVRTSDIILDATDRPYCIKKRVTVTNGKTLSIRSGVTVLFDAGASLIVGTEDVSESCENFGNLEVGGVDPDSTNRTLGDTMPPAKLHGSIQFLCTQMPERNFITNAQIFSKSDDSITPLIYIGPNAHVKLLSHLFLSDGEGVALSLQGSIDEIVSIDFRGFGERAVEANPSALTGWRGPAREISEALTDDVSSLPLRIRLLPVEERYSGGVNRIPNIGIVYRSAGFFHNEQYLPKSAGHLIIDAGVIIEFEPNEVAWIGQHRLSVAGTASSRVILRGKRFSNSESAMREIAAALSNLDSSDATILSSAIETLGGKMNSSHPDFESSIKQLMKFKVGDQIISSTAIRHLEEKASDAISKIQSRRSGWAGVRVSGNYVEETIEFNFVNIEDSQIGIQVAQDEAVIFKSISEIQFSHCQTNWRLIPAPASVFSTANAARAFSDVQTVAGANHSK